MFQPLQTFPLVQYEVRPDSVDTSSRGIDDDVQLTGDTAGLQVIQDIEPLQLEVTVGNQPGCCPHLSQSPAAPVRPGGGGFRHLPGDLTGILFKPLPLLEHQPGHHQRGGLTPGLTQI